MTRIMNMTPHQVAILDENNQIVKIYPASGKLIRLAVETVPDEPLPDGTPTSRTVFGEPEGLPEDERKYSGGLAVWEEWIPTTYYIVSQLVKNALPGRKDLLVPAEVVRDSQGSIVGCKSLVR